MQGMRFGIKRILLVVIPIALSGSCGDDSPMRLYQELTGNPSGPAVVRAGIHVLHASESAFARENLSVLSAVDVATLPSNARQLLLKRRMLRRLSIEDGIQRGIFESADAGDYILPRLEKVLEDYYLYKMSDEESWSRRLHEIENDEKAIQAFLNEQRSDRISRKEFRQATRLTLERIIKERREKERGRIQEELLRRYPIEVLP